jgi:hypothetical protein
MRSVGSDELSSGFLAGLKDLGLVVGDIEKSPAKGKKVVVKPDSVEPKRRSPIRPRIDLDDLMDGIEPAEEPNEQIVGPEIPKRIVRTYAKTGLLIEDSISDYFSSSMAFLREEFIAEISRLLRQAWSLEEQITTFGDQLKVSLRDEIASIFGAVEFQITPVLNCFNPFASKFQSLFQEIEEQKQSLSPEIVRRLRNINAEVISYGACLKSHISAESFATELHELRDVRENNRSSKETLSRRIRRLFRQRLDLEMEEVRQRIEGEVMRSRSSEIDENRRKLEDREFSEEENPMDDVRILLHEVIDELENCIDKKSSFSMREVIGRIIGAVDSLKSVKHEYVRQIAKMARKVKYFKAPESSVKQEVVAAPVERERRTKMSPVSVPDTRLISAVQEKLRMLQEKRENDLENTSRFLSSIRRKEMRRMQKQISGIISPLSP